MVKNILIIGCLAVSTVLYAQQDYSPADQMLNGQEDEWSELSEKVSRVGADSRGMALPQDPGTVPVGEGVLILAALGGGYVFAKKRKS